jgi:hypothetical protein
VANFASPVLPVAALALIGVLLILCAVRDARYIARTASSEYIPVPMRVLDARLAPLNVDGMTTLPKPLTAKTSMLIVGYTYHIRARSYVSHTVFPMELEWLSPRISSLRLLDDVKAGRLNICHVNKQSPTESVLFPGWSPYLRSHVLGVSASGVLLIGIAVWLYLLA